MSSRRNKDSDGNVLKQSIARAASVQYNAEFRGFINVNLSEEQKAAFPAWAESFAFVEQLESFASDGIAFTLKIDPKSSGFMASATQRNEQSVNAGLVVTMRAKEPVKALQRVVYAVTILSRSERWESVQPMADPDRW